MLENVPGLLTRGKALFHRAKNGLETAGYRITYDVVELADYGVPQFRRRLVVLGAQSERSQSHLRPWRFRTARTSPRDCLEDRAQTIAKLPARVGSEVRSEPQSDNTDGITQGGAMSVPLVKRRLKHSIETVEDVPHFRHHFPGMSQRRPDGYLRGLRCDGMGPRLADHNKRLCECLGRDIRASQPCAAPAHCERSRATADVPPLVQV